MTVRELLKSIAPTLKTHEVVTLTSTSTQLIIDIRHHYDFHAVGKYSKSEIESHNFTDYTIIKPFTHTIYNDTNLGKPIQYSVLDDFEVYRWRIVKDENKYEWTIEIETK